MPLRPAEITSFLSGRVPLREYRDLRLEEANRNDQYVLALYDSRDRLVQRIYLDRDASRAWMTEIFEGDGSLSYRAVFGNSRTISGYQIPLHIQISNDEGILLHLGIDRYWADVSISASKFVLTAGDVHK
jgi:hypothetical protein